MWIFPLFSYVTLCMPISCLITDKLIIPQSWLTLPTGHYFHLIAVTSQDDNENLCFKLDGKEEFSLKFKSGRAAFLGRLWNGKSGEKFHYLCTPLLPPFWCATETSLIIKPVNPDLSPLTCLFGILAASCHKWWIPWTESTFESILTVQDLSGVRTAPESLSP